MENNTNRRKFLKSAAISTIALTGVPSFSQAMLSSVKDDPILSSKDAESFKTLSDKITLCGWETSLDKETSTLVLKNGPVTITGKLKFISEEKEWSISASLDGVPGRYALIDTKGDVQGYLLFLPNGSKIQMLFYHRTAQSYKGELFMEGIITFPQDSFPCRTQAQLGERVLALSTGNTNSLLNDSFFSPSNDLLLLFEGANLQVGVSDTGEYSFSLKGRIEEATEALFGFTIETNYFKNRYIPYYKPLDKERCNKAPTGWMSWNTYFDKATAQNNLDEARIGAKYFLPFGCEFWSIESWQGNSDQLPVSDFYNMNLEVNEKQFPKGMKQLADDIRALGFRPGIWMAPFGTGNKEFYKEHKTWFLHNEKGDPISSWNGQYTLDPTVKEARDHIKEIFRIASQDWGYEFFKVDGMSGRNSSYCAHLYERSEVRARFHDPNYPNPFELCIQAFREGMGDKSIFLACQGHATGAEAYYADAARLGADIVHPNQPVQWQNVLNQAKCILNQVFTHNITMIGDPDTLLVNDLPIEEARVTTTAVALSGQLTFFGDKLAELSGERIKMLQQTLPVTDVRPISLYPYFSMLPIWNLQINHKQLGNYNVIALFNWEDNPQDIEVTAKELGIDYTNNYLAYEFWTEQSIALKEDEPILLRMNIPSHSVRLIALHPFQNRPQWISSDRHVTQNGLEIIKYEWDEKINVLRGTIQLIGGFPLTMKLYLPDDYTLKQIISKKAKYTIRHESNNILAVTFLSKESVEVPFIYEFIFS